MGRFATTLTLKVPAEKLLKKLKENRQMHEENYQKALVEFKEKAITALKRRACLLEGDRAVLIPKIFQFDLPIPVNYVSAYDEVVEKLEFSEQKEVEVSGEQYRAWVNDEWDWSHSFASSTMWYNK